MARTKKEKEPKLITFKGFDKDLKCRDMQYEIGKTYKHEGDAVVCESGLHSCEYPLDVFSYYPPGDNSRYAITEISGQLKRHDGSDTKIASAEIHITAEIRIPEMIKRSVDWVMAQIKETCVESSKKNQSAATNTGYRSAASVEGKDSVAMASGYGSKAAGALGCALDEPWRAKRGREAPG